MGALILGMPALAYAETEDAVFLKIHNVNPIKNTEGKTTACEFNTTIYNRSNTNISDISVDFTWSDDTAKAQPVKTSSTLSNRRLASSNDNEPKADDNSIFSNISIPTLLAYRQKTIKQKINSDNCFLLMKDPSISVKGCRVESRRTSFTCQGLFHFVSAIDPQYYTEFKPISLDDQKAQETAQKDADRKVIDDLFNQVETSINKVNAIMNK